MKAAALGVLMFLPSMAIAGPVAEFIEEAHKIASPSRPAAEKALDALKQLAALEADERFGLPATVPALPAGASPLQPQPIYEIDLMKLRGYKPTLDPSALLSLANTGRVFYLVNAPETISSVEVREKANNEWVTFRLGQSNYAELVGTTIKNLHRAPKDTIIVEIPALQLRFIGFAAQEGVEETLMLASVVDTPEFGIVKGEARAARTILLSLIDAANRHDGRPT